MSDHVTSSWTPRVSDHAIPSRATATSSQASATSSRVTASRATPPSVTASRSPASDSRAVSPVLGVVLLLVVTVALAGVVGSIALGTTTMPSDAPRAVVDLRIDAAEDRLTFVHRGGDVLDVRDLSIRIRIDGTALAEQPPVPFFAASGFRAGPTGPFNSAASPHWAAGETASIRLAGTNDPLLSRGSTVAVALSVDGSVIVRLERRV